ncbi:hypothetical protein [Bradyrhizobium cenepequi]
MANRNDVPAAISEPSVIPGRPKDEPGIHRAASAGGEMDFGLDAEPVIGPRLARTRWHRPEMTEREFASNSNMICSVQSSCEKHSAFAVGQISTITPRVSPE